MAGLMGYRELHRTVKLRLGVGFCQRFMDIMLVPLMVIHFSGLYGPALAGLMTLGTAVVAIGGTLAGGHLADVHGRRPILLLGELGGVLCFAGLALVNSPLGGSGVLTYVLYLGAAGCAAIALPAGEAMIADVSTPENRTTVYTLKYWSINVAFMLGSLTGGFLYTGFFFHLLLAGVAVNLGIFLVTWLAVGETAPSGTAGGLGAMLTGYVSVARDQIFLRLVLAALLVRAIEVQISTYIAVRLSSDFTPQPLLDAGPWHLTVDGVNTLGILRAVNTALVVCLGLFAARLFGRLTEERRLVVGIALFTAGYVVWAVSGDVWVLIGAAVVVTVGELMNAPVKQTLLANLVPASDRTKYMAAYGLAIRLGLVVGSVCVSLGSVLPSWGMAALYVVFGATAVQLYRSLFRELRHRTPELEGARSGD
ncbi:MFS transporter [Spongiactinospora sp. TRM90649]|uniref:MFS transporter n=1 Tax=Spongiactinospora sp. TRM90649 TaxID=3031114 RepID=UPI0023F9DB63|nr:MFS transporter [Spongiactinospora sp. TRM90649]MDF5753550.1 MFS transporter [Spongiactinospora sp. TRM90649]